MSTDLVTKCREFLEAWGYLVSGERGRLKDLIPSLIRFLSYEGEESALAEAARYLGIVGAGVPAVVMPLVALIARDPVTSTASEIKLNLDRDKPWRFETAALAATEALKRIAGDCAIDEVGVLCRNRDAQVRFRAARALQFLKQPAEKVIPLLRVLSEDQQVEVRRLVPLALWAYKHLDAVTVSAVNALASDRDVIARLRADYLLAGKVPGYERRYVDGAGQMADLLLQDPPDETTQGVLGSIPMMGNDATPFMEEIIQRLERCVDLTISGSGAVVFALRDLSAHHALAKRIRRYLLLLAARGSTTGRQVLSLWDAELRPKSLQE